MDIRELQKEIDQVSIMLYQNKEQEALEGVAGLFGKLKEITDALLHVRDGSEEEMQAFIIGMYQSLKAAYEHKDMLAMADCLQEYALTAAELYQIKC